MVHGSEFGMVTQGRGVEQVSDQVVFIQLTEVLIFQFCFGGFKCGLQVAQLSFTDPAQVETDGLINSGIDSVGDCCGAIGRFREGHAEEIDITKSGFLAGGDNLAIDAQFRFDLDQVSRQGTRQFIRLNRAAVSVGNGQIGFDDRLIFCGGRGVTQCDLLARQFGQAFAVHQARRGAVRQRTGAVFNLERQLMAQGIRDGGEGPAFDLRCIGQGSKQIRKLLLNDLFPADDVPDGGGGKILFDV